jgi:hypothetical protein
MSRTLLRSFLLFVIVLFPGSAMVLEGSPSLALHREAYQLFPVH